MPVLTDCGLMVRMSRLQLQRRMLTPSSTSLEISYCLVPCVHCTSPHSQPLNISVFWFQILMNVPLDQTAIKDLTALTQLDPTPAPAGHHTPAMGKIALV